jgi:hypothetical protein
MIGMLVVVVIVACVAWIVGMRRRRAHVYSTPVPAGGISRETLAFTAFAHGNSCLGAGQFADAIAAFHEARALDPKRAYVGERLAEAERQQRAASAPSLVTATV